MIEIFLFVNPIGVACFKNEQAVIQTIKSTKQEVKYHVIPISNIETIRADIKRRGLSLSSLEVHNEVATATYNALRDYHAVSLFGNKKARRFLLRLQNAINVHHEPYSTNLVHRILSELNINLKAFNANRASRYCKQAMDADFDLATELNVKTTPTTIIFNYEKDDDCGVLIEGLVEPDVLNKIILTQFEANDFATSYNNMQQRYGNLTVL
ncbi:dithiol-disulfide isomerase [Amylolactobacillus amylotrophicus DSM 20534]|uniref:Dithiol-disulfide isomerase n=3 Tax=Amylolactobacillus TaxID=2767876 RepID=A0A0R1YJT0_9LACO|nr:MULTISPECIES: DsbA family protein [Amylolactobacillus]APT18917.1 hypothetical protein LA20533_06495 [Amylolactobacillus amylophilus DSM 20533 = JCM 1125]KRK38827.1 dithiol-disulfide isomerase [Amylolactobacillus amylotrophicus DSM 20534]KRM42530.1 dithiol-disulfide isomerase [Amylolactobacillus amylophilus DSM 20533 = JCM 1125]GED80049.1 DsbA family protein [Amylolactobacillus amylophilus]